MTSIDGTSRNTSLERWHQLILEGVKKMGRDAAYSSLSYGRWMQEIGFVDIVEKRYALPTNPWAKGSDKKELGFMQMTNIMNGLTGMTTKLFVTKHGMALDEIEKLIGGVRKDIQDRDIHSYYPM